MNKNIFKVSDLVSLNGGIAKAFEKNKRAIELATTGGGIAKAIANNQRAIEMISNSSGIAKVIEHNKKAIDRVVLSGGLAKAIANNQKMIEMISSGGIAKAIERNRQAVDLISSSGGIAKVMLDNRRAIEMISVGGGIAKAMEQNRQAIEMSISGGGFAKALVANRSSISSVLEKFAEKGWYESAVAVVENELEGGGLSPDQEITSEVLSTELESLSKANDSKSFLNLFSKLPILIQLILLFSFSEVILPQINSISANLITPYVDMYMSSDEISPREKVKKIENMPLIDGGYEFESLRFISGDDVSFREEPSTKSEIIDSFDIGRVVVLLQKERRWTEIQVQYDDGTIEEGWVHSRYVRKFKKANNTP